MGAAVTAMFDADTAAEFAEVEWVDGREEVDEEGEGVEEMGFDRSLDEEGDNGVLEDVPFGKGRVVPRGNASGGRVFTADPLGLLNFTQSHGRGIE